MLRSVNWALAGTAAMMVAATPAASANLNAFMDVSSLFWFFEEPAVSTSPQPGKRHHDQVGEDDEQDENDELGHQERVHPADDRAHGHAGDAAHHVQHDSDRRRDQPDGVVDDEQHTEID